MCLISLFFFHCAFFSLSYSVMYNIEYWAGPCCTDVVEVPVRKFLCVRELHADIICTMDCLEHLWCQADVGKGALEFSSYPQFLPVQSSSGIIFDCLPPDPHNCALLLILGVPDRKSSLKKKEKQTTGSVFAQPFQVLLFFNMCLYTNITAWP